MFIELLSKLEKKYQKLYLTTDQSSHKSFEKIYDYMKNLIMMNCTKLKKIIRI